MAWRTTEAAVRLIIDSDNSIAVAPFIDAANALANKVESEDSDGELTDALLEQIEKFLAAHFYEHRDHALASESDGKASGVYQGQFGMRLDSSKWGQTALLLDVTGFLNSLSKGRATASAAWLGRPPSEQTDYEDRD